MTGGTNDKMRSLWIGWQPADSERWLLMDLVGWQRQTSQVNNTNNRRQIADKDKLNGKDSGINSVGCQCH